MYGVVNKAIESLVTENYGLEKWHAVKQKSGVAIDIFVGSESYDDDITYKLAIAAADVLQTSVDDILIAFGEYWILKTGMERYGSLMKAGGANLKTFLVNLPSFHDRIMLIYPKLTPPEFRVSDISNNSLNLHYFSKRPGLQEFVRGLIQGLGKLYQTPVAIQLLQSRNDGSNHEIFHIEW